MRGRDWYHELQRKERNAADHAPLHAQGHSYQSHHNIPCCILQHQIVNHLVASAEQYAARTRHHPDSYDMLNSLRFSDMQMHERVRWPIGPSLYADACIGWTR
jgi:hypothetical protein